VAPAHRGRNCEGASATSTEEVPAHAGTRHWRGGHVLQSDSHSPGGRALRGAEGQRAERGERGERGSSLRASSRVKLTPTSLSAWSAAAPKGRQCGWQGRLQEPRPGIRRRSLAGGCLGEGPSEGEAETPSSGSCPCFCCASTRVCKAALPALSQKLPCTFTEAPCSSPDAVLHFSGSLLVFPQMLQKKGCSVLGSSDKGPSER